VFLFGLQLNRHGQFSRLIRRSTAAVSVGRTPESTKVSLLTFPVWGRGVVRRLPSQSHPSPGVFLLRLLSDLEFPKGASRAMCAAGRAATSPPRPLPAFRLSGSS